MKLRIACVFVAFVSVVLSMAAQTSASNAVSAQVPPVIQFSNVAKTEAGNPLTGTVEITFSLYNNSQGGASLWSETQNVSPDDSGHYSVYLGITKPNGVPMSLFTNGQAHWLGVQIAGQAEQPRVFLVSVPYAMKAGDAATIGGLPPSAFVLAAPASGLAGTVMGTSAASSDSVSPLTSSDVTTSGGTVNVLPLFSTATDIENSAITQTGSGTTAKIGIGTTTPASTLDIQGGSTVRGTLSLPAAGTATATTGANSRPLKLSASAFNTSSSAAVNQNFQWQAEPAGNDTASPSATLNLLFGSGTATPTATGLNIASTGIITFAKGQIFPGTGTVTSVGSGTGLTGGPITASGTLSIATGGVSNAMLANPSLTVAPGTGLTGGGAVALGDTTTLNLDTTKVPLLSAANAFVGNQAITGNLTDTGNISATGEISATNILADATSGNGVKGLAITGNGVEGVASSGVGVYGVGGDMGVRGESCGKGGRGVVGVACYGAGVYGQTGSSTVGVDGVDGFSINDAAYVAGVRGSANADNATNPTVGVFGDSSSSVGYGVLGSAIGESGTGSGLSPFPTGVWGDTSGVGVGVLGTVDNGNALEGFNNSSQYATLYVENLDNSSTANPMLTAVSTGYCEIDVGGDLTCSGSKSAVVPVEGGARKVALYAVEAPENWFEDAGSGQLVNGSARIDLESTFAQTVNTGVGYHVFLTPNGDCKGLYVSQKSATSFEVRELGGGRSSIAFDYRIMARRLGYENIRLADKTAQSQRIAASVKAKMKPSNSPRESYQAAFARPLHPQAAALALPVHPQGNKGNTGKPLVKTPQ